MVTSGVGVIPGTELDFEIESEVWNIYELDDGSTLKMRTILTKVLRDPTSRPPIGTPPGLEGFGTSTTFNNVVIVHRANLREMGPPNTRPGPLEEAELIEVEYRPYSEDWNVYRIIGEGIPEGLKIRVRLVVSSVNKARGFFDQFGYPVYTVNSTNAIVPEIPRQRRRR